jgi:ketosteroid isomerase-like protein
MTDAQTAGLERRLAQLETAEEVRALAAAYAAACDTNDLHGLRAIMAPDVVVTVGELRFAGHEEVAGFFRASWGEAGTPSRHFVTNVALHVLEPDRAEATASFLYLAGIGGRSVVGWGTYRDTFTRVDDVLVFQSKDIEMTITDLAEGWPEAFTLRGGTDA